MAVRDGLYDPDADSRAKALIGKASLVALGPWAGEVGPEYVYWIGFLESLKRKGLFQGREVVAVSRGGVAAWYSSVAQRYVDLLDLLSADEFKALREEQPNIKQRRWTPAERAAMEGVKDCVGWKGRSVAVLHPGIMWNQVERWTRSRRDLDWLLERVAYAPFGPAPKEIADYVDSLGLPPNFTFARFYSSKLFPANERTKAFAEGILRKLTQSGPVVTTGLKSSLDDHEHLSFGGIIDLSDKLPNQTNLGVQTEIVRRSQRYVGTYGGLSVLPAFVGKPSLSFYAEPLKDCGFEDIHFRHEAITTEIFRQFNQPYQVINLKAWDEFQLTSF